MRGAGPHASTDSNPCRFAAILNDDYPGRYSPVRGSRLRVGSDPRSIGSTVGLLRKLSSSALTRCTSLAHQRTNAAAPISPTANAITGAIACCLQLGVTEVPEPFQPGARS